MSNQLVGKRLDLDRVAMILVEAVFYGDIPTAARWGITERTIRNYRTMLNEDAELSVIFRLKKEKFETEWANEIPAAMRAGLRFLMRAAEDADHKNPDVIHAIAGGMKIMAEIGLTKEIIDARLGRGDRQEREENRSLVPGDYIDADTIDGTTE